MKLKFIQNYNCYKFVLTFSEIILNVFLLLKDQGKEEDKEIISTTALVFYEKNPPP